MREQMEKFAEEQKEIAERWLDQHRRYVLAVIGTSNALAAAWYASAMGRCGSEITNDVPKL